ncbi:MAG: hypothetical protein JWM35_2448 [Verrucomicrobia bacterium]|nr:hypothetical protein [Verrucomicrobiota bacterium]
MDRTTSIGCDFVNFQAPILWYRVVRFPHRTSGPDEQGFEKMCEGWRPMRFTKEVRSAKYSGGLRGRRMDHGVGTKGRLAAKRRKGRRKHITIGLGPDFDPESLMHFFATICASSRPTGVYWCRLARGGLKDWRGVKRGPPLAHARGYLGIRKSTRASRTLRAILSWWKVAAPSEARRA